MSLLGIDVGTTGCKSAAFATDGTLLASAYEEYDLQRPAPGWAELDAPTVWAKIQRTIRRVAAQTAADPIRALAVSSMGEAVVPVTLDRQILGPSINPNFDMRGQEYLAALGASMDRVRLYDLNGNTLGNPYTLTKLKWIQEHQPDLYRQTDRFLLWGSLVPFMLGAEPCVDYTLANRTLLFDVGRAAWSSELLDWAGLDLSRLPDPVPSGTAIGTLSPQAAAGLGLPPGVALVTGAHDQCANAVGCGAIEAGRAVYGMGTFFCITPAFRKRRAPEAMLTQGLNTEHHAVPGLYVTFLYNQGGALLKWFRDTFAAVEHQLAREAGQDIYAELIAELPPGPSRVVALPHWAPTGPPEFIADSSGVLAGLHLDTSRGEVLKGLLEGVTFYLKAAVDALPPTGIEIADFRAVGGGSKSDNWIQLSADIMGRPFLRPRVTEAGALGAAIIAGVGSGTFGSYAEGVAAMVHPDRAFEPDFSTHRRYAERFALYQRLGPLMRDYLRQLG
jgi:xylulokinase